MGKIRENEVFWNQRSKIYDEQVGPVYRQAYGKTIKHSLKFLGEEDRLLELGCGTGLVTFPVAKHVKEILAADTSGEMLEKAEAKAKERGAQNVKFSHSDLLGLELPRKSLDGVLACNVLLYLKNQDEILDEIWHILKPGGMFLSATDCLGRNLSNDSVRKYVKSKLHLMPYVSFETPIGLMRKIQKHGFLVLEIANLHKNPPNIFIAAQKIEK